MKPHELQMIKTALGKCWEMLRSEGYKKFGCITEAEKIIEKYESQSRLSQPGECDHDLESLGTMAVKCIRCYEVFEANQSTLSQPVRECKYVWFVENENNEWLVNKKTFTNNPLEAARFSSEEEAVEYIIHSELHDCKPTQHEFVSQPLKAYCTCNFAMINRDQETQIPFCFECKKEINESQPVTGYSEEEVLDLVKWLRENASRNNAGKWGYFGNKYCDKTDEEMFELFQSLKSKSNNGSNEGATRYGDAVEFHRWMKENEYTQENINLSEWELYTKFKEGRI